MAHATQNIDEVLDNSTILLDLVNFITENEVFNSSIMNELAVQKKLMVILKHLLLS